VLQVIWLAFRSAAYRRFDVESAYRATWTHYHARREMVYLTMWGGSAGGTRSRRQWLLTGDELWSCTERRRKSLLRSRHCGVMSDRRNVVVAGEWFVTRIVNRILGGTDECGLGRGRGSMGGIGRRMVCRSAV
jgi:hypothetical protein